MKDSFNFSASMASRLKFVGTPFHRNEQILIDPPEADKSESYKFIRLWRRINTPPEAGRCKIKTKIISILRLNKITHPDNIGIQTDFLPNASYLIIFKRFSFDVIFQNHLLKAPQKNGACPEQIEGLRIYE